MYIRSDVAFNPRTDIANGLETVWAELYLPKTKPILFGVCYCPLKQMNFFFEQSCLECNSFPDTECIIMGDVNVDIQNSKSNLFKSLNHFLNTFDLTQVINCPTRVDVSKNTLIIIDLMIVSDPVNIVASDVVDCGVSDHMLI